MQVDYLPAELPGIHKCGMEATAWVKAQEDGRMGGWKEGRKVDGGRVGRWMGGWKEGWMGGRAGRCMEGSHQLTGITKHQVSR